MRKLTEEAQRDRIAFERYSKDAGCACHIMPPCAYCTHSGNPLNQEEDESCWEIVYTKDEALFYAVCQMRRAARMLDLEETQHDGREYLVDIYGRGLDLCADEIEKMIEPTELERMWRETFPNGVGKFGACDNPLHGIPHEQNSLCTNFTETEVEA